MTASTFSRHGLILSSDRCRTGLDDTVYLRALHRGELVRVRHGAYCEASHWAELTPRDRYLLRIRAVVLATTRPVVLCSYSAAAVWGMPILGQWPSDVHVLAAAASGGRSSRGITRHPVELAAGLAQERNGLLMTGVARTALDLIMVSEFSPAVGSLDWALWRRNRVRVTAHSVREELERLNPRYQRGHALAVIDFGTHLSDSFGESMTRGVTFELGYRVPELQVSFSDQRGHIGDTDYFWRSERCVGEFDGATKYLRPEYLGNLTPAETVWWEKKREDRLRRQCDGVVRIIWEETCDPPRLDALLREAGLRPERESRLGLGLGSDSSARRGR